MHNQLLTKSFHHEKAFYVLFFNVIFHQGRLDQPEQLVNEMFGLESKPVEVLGTDLVECLYWRRGALFYMYCHTLFNDNERRHLNRVHLMECAESGVKYLESMLSVRSPLVLDEQENVDVKDIDMVHLLKEGLCYCFREGPWVIILTK